MIRYVEQTKLHHYTEFSKINETVEDSSGKFQRLNSVLRECLNALC